MKVRSSIVPVLVKIAATLPASNAAVQGHAMNAKGVLLMGDLLSSFVRATAQDRWKRQ
jgi:hypothetical protein